MNSIKRNLWTGLDKGVNGTKERKAMGMGKILSHAPLPRWLAYLTHQFN